MKIKLLVLDFDGTALGGYEPYDRFPDNLSAFLDKISASGILWATCTTWHPYIQEEVFKRSRLKSKPVRTIGRTALNCGVYINGKIYLDAEWDHEMLSKKVEFDKEYVGTVRDFLKTCPGITNLVEHFDYIFSIEYTTDRKEITEALNSCIIIREKTYILFLPDGKTCQVFPNYMSKGLAIKKIQKQLSISAGSTMVACDGVNDLPMLDKDIAGFQIAPSNAAPEVKKRIKENNGIVSELPYSDGIVDAGKKLFLSD